MKILMVVIMLVGLSGCADWQAPVGAGSAPDELPRSPCACGEPFYQNGEWI